jgi:hypothetical protein
MSRHDACQGQYPPGWPTSRPKSCGMTVNHLPLVYKSRRWPLAVGDGRTDDTRISARSLAPTYDIGICLNQFARTWRLLLLSRLACSPPLQAPRCLAIQPHERRLAECTTLDWNPDKPRVTMLLSVGHRETDLSASTC